MLKTTFGDEPFALLLGDTIIKNGTPCTETLISAAEAHDTSVLSLERVPWEQVPSYGVADVGGRRRGCREFPRPLKNHLETKLRRISRLPADTC